jgi:hypothetical protein
LFRSVEREWPWPARRVRQRRTFSTTTYDEHLVVVAAANLDKALERCPRRLRAVLQISSNETRALRLLRNIYEHWDELRDPYRREGELRASAKKLHDEFPGADPWSIIVDPDTNEISLAAVVPLRAFTKELRRLEARVLRAERAHHRAATGAAPYA